MRPEDNLLENFNDCARKVDITKYRLLEAELEQCQKMGVIGLLAGGIAHDFNNLLTGISGYVHLLLARTKKDSSVAADLCQVQELAARASGLARQLLAFSSQQPLEPRVININPLVENTTEVLTRLIGENIDLTLMAAPDLGNIRVDPTQLEQVLMNLAVNARDAMPKGGKLVIKTANVTLGQKYFDKHIGKHIGDKPRDYVMLSIADTGCGMDQETRQRIFEPFFTTKEPEKGTGLGLVVVCAIVKRHGGSICLYSKPGKGTVFRIYLPRVCDEAEQLPTKATEGSIPPHGSETILLVEDEEGVRTFARRVLEEQGHTVLAAATPDEAEVMFAQSGGKVDLLLTDFVMPGRNGLELHDLLARTQKSLKVVCMSGYNDSVVFAGDKRKSGTAFVQKPFSPETLGRKIREVLDRA